MENNAQNLLSKSHVCLYPIQGMPEMVPQVRFYSTVSTIRDGIASFLELRSSLVRSAKSISSTLLYAILL
jgi:hypothetical protein